MSLIAAFCRWSATPSHVVLSSYFALGPGDDSFLFLVGYRELVYFSVVHLFLSSFTP